MKGNNGETLLNALCEYEPHRPHDRALVEGLIDDGIRWRQMSQRLDLLESEAELVETIAHMIVSDSLDAMDESELAKQIVALVRGFEKATKR